jgi:predicted dinucleotide-binding enzyme
MASPVLNGQPSTLLIAGDDESAKVVVADLAMKIFFAPLHVGGIKNAALTEAAVWLWIYLTQKLGRFFAFILSRLEATV